MQVDCLFHLERNISKFNIHQKLKDFKIIFNLYVKDKEKPKNV